MTEKYENPPPSIDREISEIPAQKSRSKVIATIVDYEHPNLLINDGSDQIRVSIPGYARISAELLFVGATGRFLIERDSIEEEFIDRILAFHPMNKEQVNKYKQLVKIERSQSK